MGVGGGGGGVGRVGGRGRGWQEGEGGSLCKIKLLFKNVQ